MRAYNCVVLGFLMACSSSSPDAASGSGLAAAVGGESRDSSPGAGAGGAKAQASVAGGAAGTAAAIASTHAGAAAQSPQGGSAAVADAGTSAPRPQSPAADSRSNAKAGAGSSEPSGPPAAGGPSAPAAGSGSTEAPALMGVGSCCTTHATPGCGNADLQVCVCEQLPSCCTEKWDAACTFIITQKHCQPGIRECVCGSASDQWGQNQCCEQRWSNTCDQVAETKCGAERGCF